MVLAITQLRIEKFTALQMKLFMPFCRSLQENELCIDLLTVWKLVQIYNSPLHNLISHSNCNLNIRFHLIIALTATRVVAYFLSFSPVILSHEAVDCLAEETDHAIIGRFHTHPPHLIFQPIFHHVYSFHDFETSKALAERSHPSSKPTGRFRDAVELSRNKMNLSKWEPLDMGRTVPHSFLGKGIFTKGVWQGRSGIVPRIHTTLKVNSLVDSTESSDLLRFW